MSLAHDYVTSSVSIIEYEMKHSVPTVGMKTPIREPGDRNEEYKPRRRHDVTSVSVDNIPFSLFMLFSFLHRTFAVKKLGNTKIDSRIVMPIMTI